MTVTVNIPSLEGSAKPMTNTLLQYSYLQLLDLLTTMAFLLHGVQEGNPLVKLAIQYAPHPFQGLLAVKVAALLLGVYCWRARKLPLLGKANVAFALLVAWNLVALILGSTFNARVA
jgi:hypothetical protein